MNPKERRDIWAVGSPIAFENAKDWLQRLANLKQRKGTPEQKNSEFRRIQKEIRAEFGPGAIIRDLELNPEKTQEPEAVPQQPAAVPEVTPVAPEVEPPPVPITEEVSAGLEDEGELPGQIEQPKIVSPVEAEQQPSSVEASPEVVEQALEVVAAETLTQAKDKAFDEVAAVAAVQGKPAPERGAFRQWFDRHFSNETTKEKLNYIAVGAGARIGVSVAAKMTARAVLGSLSFGTSVAIGAAAGGIAGAAAETWKINKERYNFNELGQLIDKGGIDLSVKLAELKAEQKMAHDNFHSIKDYPAHEAVSQQIQLLERIQETKIALQNGEKRTKALKDMLSYDFKNIREHVAKSADGKLDPQLDQIYAHLESRRWDKEKLKRVAGKAAMGAAAGVLGSTITGAAMEYAAHHGLAIGDLIGMHSPSADNFLGSHADIAGQHVLDHAQGGLTNFNYHAVIRPGDGDTQIARRLLHDYWANVRHLNPNAPMPTPEQAVYAEDALRHAVALHVGENLTADQIGTAVSIHGSVIADAANHAMGLSHESIQNLHGLLATPDHHLGSTAMGYIGDHTFVSDAANDHYSQALTETMQAKMSAAQAAAERFIVDPIARGAVNFEQAVAQGGQFLAEYTGHAADTIRENLSAIYADEETRNLALVVLTTAGSTVAVRAFLNRRRETQGESSKEDKNRFYQPIRGLNLDPDREQRNRDVFEREYAEQKLWDESMPFIAEGMDGFAMGNLTFSETLAINSDGQLNLRNDAFGAKSSFRTEMLNRLEPLKLNVDRFTAMTKEVTKRYPNVKFTVRKNPNNTVTWTIQRTIPTPDIQYRTSEE